MGKKSGTTSTGNNYYASNACVLSVGPCERLVFVEVGGKEEYFSSSGIDLASAAVPYSLEVASGRIRFYRGTGSQVVQGGTNPNAWPSPVPETHPDYASLVGKIADNVYSPVPYNDPNKAILKLDAYSSNFRHLVIVEFDDFFMGFERHNFPTVRFGFSRIPDQNVITGPSAQADSFLQVNPMALMAEAWTNKIYCLGRPENTLHQPSWQAVADELHANNELNYISAKYTKPITFNQLIKDMAGYTGVYLKDNDQGQIVAGRFPQSEAAPVGIPVITDDDLEIGSKVRIVPTTTAAQASEFEMTWTNPRLSFGDDKVKATSARNRPDPNLGETKEYKAPFIQRGNQATYQVNRRASLDSKTYFKISGVVISETKADELDIGEPFVLHLEYEGRTFEKICFPTRMVGSSESRMEVSIDCESSRGYFSTQEFEDYVDEEVAPDTPIPELPHWDVFQATSFMSEQPFSLFFLASRNDPTTTGFNGFFRSVSSELQQISQQRVFGIPLEVVSGVSSAGPKEENTGSLTVKRVDPLDTLGWDSFPKALSDEQYEDDEVYLIVVRSASADYYPFPFSWNSPYKPKSDYQQFELMSMKSIGNASGDITDPVYEVSCRRNIGGTESTTIEAGQRIWAVRKSDMVYFTHALIEGMEKGDTALDRTGHFAVQPFRADEKRDFSGDSEKSLELQRTKLDDLTVGTPLTGNAYLYEDSRGFRPQVYLKVSDIDPLVSRLIVEYGPRAEAEAGTWRYFRNFSVGGSYGPELPGSDPERSTEILIRHNLTEGTEFRFRIRGHQSVGFGFPGAFRRDPATAEPPTTGIFTDWVYSDPITPIGKSAPPTDPVSFSLSATPNGMEISIPEHPDKDFKHYNVFVNSGPTLPGVRSFTMNDSLRSLSNLAAGQTYYVWIQAEDFDGNKSTVLGSQTVVPKPGVPSGGSISFNVSSLQAQNTDFTYSNYNPEEHNVTPVMRVGGQVKSYSQTATNDTWRYEVASFSTEGGDRNTSTAPAEALGILNNANFVGGKQKVSGIAIYRDDLGIDWPEDFQVEWIQVRTGNVPLFVQDLKRNIPLTPSSSVGEADASYNPAAYSITPEVLWDMVPVTYNSTPTNGSWRYGNVEYPHGEENLVLSGAAIGYTSVTQMPFQRIDCEIIYRDSQGEDHSTQVEASFTQQYVISGQNGVDAADLSLEVASITVSTNEDGSGGDYSQVKTSYKVILGGIDDTSEWTISTVATDCTHTHDTVNDEVAITSAQEDYAYVTLTATKPGATDLVKRFAVFKSKNEAAADAAEALTKANEAIADAGAAVIAANTALTTADNAETTANNAVATAALDATAKADAAEAAALAASQIAANAYTDDQITAEEARAIADAQTKADAAQAAAEATAQTLADAAEAAAQAAAIAAAALDASTKADAAKDAAEAAAVITSNAYADGLVTAEEARAIADAQAKADAAQAAAIAAAGLVSQAQADQATADAIAAAALDASTKANTAEAQAIAAAALTSAQEASDAQAAAVAAASLDATTKADAAQSAATSAATLAANAYSDGLVDAEEVRAIADATAKANAAQVAAIAAAETDATTKADAAEAAAVLAAAVQANAYADGIVSAEEVRAIADAQAKADAAEAAAIAAAGLVSQAQADQAEADAIAAAALDAQTKAAAAQAAAIAAAALDASTKADAAEAAAITASGTAANAYADGLVTAEEARAIADATAKANAAQAAAIAAAGTDATTKANAAEAAAEAAATLAANAYSDGLVSAEETRAINDATAKANAAQAAAIAAAQSYADGTFLTEAVWGVEVIPPLRFQDVAVPSVAGLYSTDTYMGFHNGNSQLSGWRSYIQSDGQVFFGNPAGHYISWDNLVFSIKGNLVAAGGTFSGNLVAAGGTFSGSLVAVGGTFSGDLSAAGGTFSGDLSAAGGTFSGSLVAAGGTFSGDLSAAGGSFAGSVDITGNSSITDDLTIGTGGSIFSDSWGQDLFGFHISADGAAEFNESFKVTNQDDGVFFRLGTSDGGGILIETNEFQLTSTGISLLSSSAEIKGNYTSGSSGFLLRGDGVFEVNNGTFRGDILGSTSLNIENNYGRFVYSTSDDTLIIQEKYSGSYRQKVEINPTKITGFGTTIKESWEVGGNGISSLRKPSSTVYTKHFVGFTGNDRTSLGILNDDLTSTQVEVVGNNNSAYAYPAFKMGDTMRLVWAEVDLFRSATNLLRTTKGFQADGNITANTDMIANRLRCRTGQQLVLSAGESTISTGQTAEFVYVNSENGLEVNSSTNNWATGWDSSERTCWKIDRDHMWWGRNGAYDTNLYRSAANVLRTSDTFQAAKAYTDSHYDLAAAADHAIRFWGGDQKYSINMSNYGDGIHGKRLDGSSDYNMYFRMSGGTNRGFVFKNDTSPKAQIDGAGNILAVGDITAYVSDIRLKDVEGDITDAVEKVKRLRGFYFRTNALAKSMDIPDFGRQVGVSAQEVAEVLPEIIRPAPGNPKYMTLDYGKITPLLIEAVKEQQDQIEALLDRIAKLES